MSEKPFEHNKCVGRGMAIQQLSKTMMNPKDNVRNSSMVSIIILYKWYSIMRVK